MKKEELESIAKGWIKAWNEYDHLTLQSMMKPNSCFAKMGAILNPIIAHGQPIISENYATEWFYQTISAYKQAGITFSIDSIKAGEGFVQIKSRSSLGHFVVDYLRIEVDGKIDQQIRNSDMIHWVEIV